MSHSHLEYALSYKVREVFFLYQYYDFHLQITYNGIVI